MFGFALQHALTAFGFLCCHALETIQTFLFLPDSRCFTNEFFDLNPVMRGATMEPLIIDWLDQTDQSTRRHLLEKANFAHLDFCFVGSVEVYHSGP